MRFPDIQVPGYEEELQKFQLVLRQFHRHLPGEKIPAAVS